MNDIVLIPAFIGLAVMMYSVFRTPGSEHRLFWSGAAITVISTFFIGLPHGWKSGVGGSACAAAAIAATAYLYTPFINIRGKTRTFYSDQKQPYGAGVTTPKAWWQLLFAVTIFMYPVFAYATARSGPAQIAISAGVAIATGASFGYRDRFLDNPVAARQRLPFALVSLVTLGTFPVCYLATYYGSRHQIAKRAQYGRHSHRRS